jgi:hypothetical protein
VLQIKADGFSSVFPPTPEMVIFSIDIMQLDLPVQARRGTGVPPEAEAAFRLIASTGLVFNCPGALDPMIACLIISSK